MKDNTLTLLQLAGKKGALQRWAHKHNAVERFKKQLQLDTALKQQRSQRPSIAPTTESTTAFAERQAERPAKGG